MSLSLCRRMLGIASIAAAGIVVASSVWSEPLTQRVRFEVPVRLTDIHPDIKSFSVQCQLGGHILGMREDIKFQGHYSGVVRLTSEPIANELVGSIKEWRCQLRLFPAAGQGQMPSFNAPDEKFRAKAGTKLLAEARGPIAPAGQLRVAPPPLQRPNIPQ